MQQKVLHIAYGMNAAEIPTLTDKQLISAFFMADTNLPSIGFQYRSNIRHNMDLIAYEMGRRVDRAKGIRKVRLDVHLMAMQAVLKFLYTNLEGR